MNLKMFVILPIRIVGLTNCYGLPTCPVNSSSYKMMESRSDLT